MNVLTRLKVKQWLVFVLAAFLVACASSSSGPSASSAAKWPAPANVAVEKAGFTSAGLAAFDARMKEAVDKGEISGIVTLVSRHGQLAAFNAHGVQSYESKTPMTVDSLFRIYSMTKPITGVALMQLYEKGLWKVDDPVTKFVPELANLKVYKGKDADGKEIFVPAARPATMRELMTHTAGLGYGLSATNPVDIAFQAEAPLAKPNMKSMVDTVAKLPLLAQPGERWSYSIAVDIQGAIVERLSGEKFGAYLKKHIFEPLGMSETRFYLAEKDRARLASVYQWDRTKNKLEVFPDPEGRGFFDANHVESGGGGLISTAHDYARFCQMLLNKGTLDGKQIIKPDSVALMAQNHIGSLRIFNDGNRPTSGQAGIGFGLDFSVVTDPTAANTKQGVGTYSWFGIAGTWFWVDPQNDLFVIGMIQRRGGAGQGAVNFRGDSAKLVYDALQ
jgi:CubicO group peptidase (beta-lactamase class C family)